MNWKGTKTLGFEKTLIEKKQFVDRFLQQYMKRKDGVPDIIYQAMEYSLFAGGKRLRPILVMSGCEICTADPVQVMPLACAVEMIHTYSLIHDDLPAMDDDDYRRGKPTSHKAFGEGIAILAGDGLLNYAFELMLSITPLEGGRLKAIREIARASGVEGMVGGQVLDLESEGRQVSMEVLNDLHCRKTGALICASITAGAQAAGCSQEEYLKLQEFGKKLGLAFQIQDDILNVTGDRKLMGKSTGSDASRDKSTYVSLLGVPASEDMVKTLTDEAKTCLEGFGDRAQFLKQLTDYLVDRKY